MSDFVNGISMAGGDGSESYSNNSSYQKAVMEASKLLIQNSIADHLVVPDTLLFRIADLGCSVGPNTFTAIDIILDSVKLKFPTHKKKPEFQVYFNDHALNDFNTLFKNLPPNREYYSSGVPGSFYIRLFPSSSLHLIHSSYSLHWLSRVPAEIMDPTSPSFNKGRIYYHGDNNATKAAYSRQHAHDFSVFLDSRAQEIVPGGLLMLVLPARPNGVDRSQGPLPIAINLLGACLMDLVRKGVVEEEKVDTFNLPLYLASPDEIEEIVKRDGHFDIERMEGLPDVQVGYRCPEDVSRGVRAVMGELIKAHFGHEILEAVFHIFEKKNAEVPMPGSELNLFILLKLKKEDN